MHPNDALRLLATTVTPTSAETSAARIHFRTIAVRLQQSFGASRFIPIGSHARGTAVKIHSDIDMLAVLPRKSARWGDHLISPRVFLAKVASDLKGRYTNTSVRADGQAVVLGFSGGLHAVDVVPGIFEGMHGSRPAYLIPGRNSQWILTSPETHDVLFSAANLRSGGKLGALARLIKTWRYGREAPIPISSFYTDMILATSDVATGIKSHGQCLRDYFDALIRRKVRGLRDPGGIAGVITACPHEAQLDKLFSAAQFARAHADAALRAESLGKASEALRQWSIVFNRRLL